MSGLSFHQSIEKLNKSIITSSAKSLSPSMASFSPASSTHIPTSFSSKQPHYHFIASLTSNKTTHHRLVISAALSDQGLGSVAPLPVDEVAGSVIFENPKWVNGTWDLNRFQKDGKTDWDSVIDAEVRRRKWLEDNPESSSNENPVSFDTSIIPWWAWVKRFHLPEAELLNGRAAMVGFFMAYFVDSLTEVGLVDQMSNFFCKTLLFVAVAGVLLIRKNEDVENLKKLIEETTFYDKQWQATWQDENESTRKSESD